MKNVFFVINKEKIYAYIVSIMTIVTIFFMSSLINSDLKKTEVTSSNSINNNAVGEAISTSTPYDASKDTNINNSNDTIKYTNTQNDASKYMRDENKDE